MNPLKNKTELKNIRRKTEGCPRVSSPTSSSLSLDAGLYFKGWKAVNRYFGPKEGYTEVPHAPGNYAIYTCPWTLKGIDFDNKVLQYIGTAVDLSERHRRHEVVRILRAITKDYILIKCRVIENKPARLTSEYRLINRLKPGCNNEPKKRRFAGNAVLCR